MARSASRREEPRTKRTIILRPEEDNYWSKGETLLDSPVVTGGGLSPGPPLGGAGEVGVAGRGGAPHPGASGAEHPVGVGDGLPVLGSGGLPPDLVAD